MTPTMTPMTMPMEPLVSTPNAPLKMADMGRGGNCEGSGGGGTSAMVGGVTTASTVMETPVTLASIAVVLLALLVALAIADCTEVAIAVGVWMRTSTMTLPDVTVTITADGLTPARAAIALFISVRTLRVKEETSPASRRAKLTTRIAGGGGGGDGGEGGVTPPPPGSNGGGGDGDGGGGGDGGGKGGKGDEGEQVETVPETPVRVVEEQTVAPDLTATLDPSGAVFPSMLQEIKLTVPP